MTVAGFDHIALPTANGVSVYVRDPDDNLVEFLCYDEPPVGRIF